MSNTPNTLNPQNTSHIYIAPQTDDYELLDSGDGMKLERYGEVVISRPDPQALWRPSLEESVWTKADAIFEKTDEKGSWLTKKQLPEKWTITYTGLRMNIRLTPFKHTGIFPEQTSNWMWSSDIIKDAIKNGHASNSAENTEEGKSWKPQVLNLFGYSGGATLAASKAGAEVTHVDASKAAMTWAHENAESSALKENPIRWILEDAAAFVKRELRRGKKYDAIIMDPPSFGRGAKGEIWKIEEDFLPLFEDCVELLSDAPLFFIINGYAAGYSPIAYENNLKILSKKYKGTTESGELTLQETGPEKRLLPCGIVARWSHQ